MPEPFDAFTVVAIQVSDPSGDLILIRTVQTDANGNFGLTFKVPSSATPGSFDIKASAKINGQTVTATKAFMQTVPEFGSVAPIVLAISILSMLLHNFLNYFCSFVKPCRGFL